MDGTKELHDKCRLTKNGEPTYDKALLAAKDLLKKYGKPTAKAMVESAKRHIDILEDLDFHDYAVSLKASNLPSAVIVIPNS